MSNSEWDEMMGKYSRGSLEFQDIVAIIHGRVSMQDLEAERMS